jgi:hypothetical protein
MGKYHAIKTVVDGQTFHSKKEANRYQELKLLEKAGEIRFLETQVSYTIRVNGMHICNYICDFRYTIPGQYPVCVEDVKGVLTPVYRLKKKLMLAVHGIEIIET